MSTDNKIRDSKPRQQGFRPIGRAAVRVKETLRERLLRAVAEDRSPTDMPDDYEEPAMPDLTPLPVEMLRETRWDDAAEFAWAALKDIPLPVELRMIIDGLFVAHEEMFPQPSKLDWVGPVARVVKALEDGGHVAEAIAWRMLQADPQQPWTFWRLMPQLDQMLLTAAGAENDIAQVQHRIVSWRRAANGDFVTRSTSIFHIAERELADEIQALDKELDVTAHSANVVKTIAERAREREQAESLTRPGVVAIPKKTATKLVDREGHAGFRDLIGAHLPHVRAPDLSEVRDALAAEYPHAAAVVQVLLRDLREDRPAVIKPTLIVGEPGGGKSRIVRRLGELLGMHVHRYDASGSNDNMFAGMSKGWSGTQPAVPVRGLSMARSGTFIMMVDELEKAGTRTHSGNLWQALGPFLEKETSSRFRDPSLDAEVDLSFVSHIATANDIDALPAFLLDRYRVVRWPMPTLEHLPALAANVLHEIEREVDEVGFNSPLDDDELEVIGRVWRRQGYSMRKLQKLVGATLDARAAVARRH